MRGAIAVRIKGRWLTGESRGTEAEIFDFRAGNLIAADPAGSLAFGLPTNFRAETGESGDQLMELLLPSPAVVDLYRGAVRESLANLWSTARIGHVETRGWENSNEYIVDNGEGDLAFVRFTADGCVGIAFSHDRNRDYDIHTAISAMPEGLKDSARELSELPFLFFNGVQQHTSLFWGEDGKLVGAEPWHTLYTFTGDILRLELLEEDVWRSEAAEHYEIPDYISAKIGVLAQSARFLGSPIPIDAGLQRMLIASDAPYAAVAREGLMSAGIFDATLQSSSQRTG